MPGTSDPPEEGHVYPLLNHLREVAKFIFGLFVAACIVWAIASSISGWAATQELQKSEQHLLELRAQTAADKEKRIAACSAHRYERVEVYPMNLRADIALDSCTGEICRTWDWAPNGTSESAWETYASAPLCRGADQ